ncbi:MAG: hypothetical protein AAFW95_10445 [Cyanobacteria bacterium J06638_6]
MPISQQIDVVYQRASRLRQQAMAQPIQPDLFHAALGELYSVLE